MAQKDVLGSIHKRFVGVAGPGAAVGRMVGAQCTADQRHAWRFGSLPVTEVLLTNPL